MSNIMTDREELLCEEIRAVEAQTGWKIVKQNHGHRLCDVEIWDKEILIKKCCFMYQRNLKHWFLLSGLSLVEINERTIKDAP